MQERDEQFDWEQYAETQRRLRDLYTSMTNKLTDDELRERNESAAAFKAQVDSMRREMDQQYQTRQLADARRIWKEHKAALRKYEKAHREEYPGPEPAEVTDGWDELLPALNDLALLHRDNPGYGGLLVAFRALDDAFSDFMWYGYPQLLRDQLIARIHAAIQSIYEGVLRRSDRHKGRWGHAAAAPLTPEERKIQSREIQQHLSGLGLDLGDIAKRSRILDALICAAHDIRRYWTPEESAEEGEYVEREGAYRGPAQAAAENIGKVLDDLLEGLFVSDEGTPVWGVEPRRGRTIMSRVAASRNRRLQRFGPVALVTRTADAVLRNELEGPLLAEAMKEIAEIINRKLEAQNRINEERES